MAQQYTSLDRCSKNANKTELIQEYFFSGYTYDEILAVLFLKHDIHISQRTLGRILKQQGLGRQCRSNQLRDAIQYELTGSGAYLGCRSLSKRLLSKYNIKASRQSVLALQKEMDPNGVEMRKSHRISRRIYRNPGPNYCVHIDGYDKLKPFGFPVHGAVDGYSRRVLWLKVGKTNNDPVVIASYFIQYINNIKGVPTIVRMDSGTENVVVQDIQNSFRMEHEGVFQGMKSVIVGSSHSNQRVERWWSSMRSGGAGYWIDMFKDMVDTGLFDTADPAHIECVRFCFKSLMQAELNQIMADWNQHRIRSNNQSGFRGGKPDLLYFTPEIFGSKDYKFDVSMNDILAVQQLNAESLPDEDNDEFIQMCRNLLRENGKNMPGDTKEAVELLTWLLNELELW